MARTASRHIKTTFTLPQDLAKELKKRVRNVSAFVAEACREKLAQESRRAREIAMIERCRVRHREDQVMADDFFSAEQEAWDSVQ